MHWVLSQTLIFVSIHHKCTLQLTIQFFPRCSVHIISIQACTIPKPISFICFSLGFTFVAGFCSLWRSIEAGQVFDKHLKCPVTAYFGLCGVVVLLFFFFFPIFRLPYFSQFSHVFKYRNMNNVFMHIE